MNTKSLLLSILLFLAVATVSHSQEKALAKGTVVRVKVHGKGLEGNLSGDSADRNVSIYLPASYKSNPKKRYPVVYFLHGFTDNDDKFYGAARHWMKLPPILDSAMATRKSAEMIFVTPNAFTRFQGSWYSNSITTGNWEEFVAKELVSYIDSHYRTIASASGRGLSGHSMGGYGAMRIGQKYPDVFSAVYLLSPATLGANTGFPPNPRAEAIKTVADFEKADFGTKAAFALAAAWSPDINNPPLYVQLPAKDGQPQPEVVAKWAANAPLASLDQYITNLRKLKAFAFEAGDKDANIAASIKVLDQELKKYGLKHTFEIYDGNHTNRIATRIRNKMLGFFSENLKK